MSDSDTYVCPGCGNTNPNTQCRMGLDVAPEECDACGWRGHWMPTIDELLNSSIVSDHAKCNTLAVVQSVVKHSERLLHLKPGPPPITPNEKTRYLVQWDDGEYGLVYWQWSVWVLRSLTDKNPEDAIAHARLPGSKNEP